MKKPKVKKERPADPDKNEIQLMFMEDGKQQVLLTIKSDGKIEKGPLFKTEDDASLKFWDLVFSAFPKWRKVLIEEAISAQIVRTADEFRVSLQTLCSLGLTPSPFDASAPALMRKRLESILNFVADSRGIGNAGKTQ